MLKRVAQAINWVTWERFAVYELTYCTGEGKVYHKSQYWHRLPPYVPVNFFDLCPASCYLENKIALIKDSPVCHQVF